MISSFSLDGKYLASMTRHGNMISSVIVHMETSTDDSIYKECAYVMITCHDDGHQVADQLRVIDEIKEIQPTCGNYDVIVKIETDSVKSLCDIISTKIRTIDKVRATTTLISSPITSF